MNRNRILLIGSLVASAGQAQIIPLDTIAEGIRPLYTLQDAGLKYMPVNPYQSSTANIYNQDLSVYRVLTIPPPPSGYTYNTMNYVTEDLFDTDPSNIEYLVHASAGFSFLTFVYREDGTLLFSTFGLPNGGMAQYLLGGYDPVVQTTMGPVLHISPMPIATEVRRYLLPGELPCLGCAGTGVNGMTEMPDEGSDVLSFPNPASEQVTLEFELPAGQRSGLLVLFDDQGRSVVTRPVDASGQVRLSTAQFVSGMYFWHILTKNGMVQGDRIVVAH